MLCLGPCPLIVGADLENRLIQLTPVDRLGGFGADPVAQGQQDIERRDEPQQRADDTAQEARSARRKEEGSDTGLKASMLSMKPLLLTSYRGAGTRSGPSSI